MCTVTLVTADGTRRLVSNRDEEHERPVAEPPQIIDGDEMQQMYPRDPRGGGTWIGANAHGVMVTVLNGNPDYEHVPAQPQTRGVLVPRLLAAATTDQVSSLATAINWSVYPACRVVASTPDATLSWWWDGREVTPATHPIDENIMFTSSGLGDDLVEAPRRELWDDWFTPGEHPFVRQDHFHRHSWDDRKELSVNMWRDDARTVSLTAVSVDAVSVTMWYHGGAPDGPGDDHQVVLYRQ